jgi:hypothetical protein
MECLFDTLELISWILLIAFVLVAIGTEIILFLKKCRRVSDLEKLISENMSETKNLQEKIDGIARKAQIRDYFVRTKYVGKLENKNLIEDFKKEIGDFEEMKNNLLNYKNISKFDSYKETLTKYEHMQIVLDTYPKKEAK